VAEIVDADDPAAVTSALSRLAADPERRVQLARNALTAGHRYFSHEATYGAFLSQLTESRMPLASTPV
jgi:hypothetical protein